MLALQYVRIGGVGEYLARDPLLVLVQPLDGRARGIGAHGEVGIVADVGVRLLVGDIAQDIGADLAVVFGWESHR